MGVRDDIISLGLNLRGLLPRPPMRSESHAVVTELRVSHLMDS